MSTSPEFGTGLYRRFEATVRRFPDAVALDLDGTTWTYRELRDVVEGIGLSATGGRIGLCASRTLEAYAAYLAVLRAGASVIPLNPAQPAARNTAILRLAGADRVLVDRWGAAQAVTLRADGHRVLDIGDAPEEIGPVARVSPNDPAYIIFTSGSTGRPKGVPTPHRCVEAYLRNVLALYNLGPGSRLSQAFDLTFDPSVHDLFVAWSAGATLVVPGPRDLLTPARYVAERRITCWCSVPSVVSLSRRYGLLRPDSMPELTCSVFMGDRLLREDALAWRNAAPAGRIHNAYGPTETTITCTGYLLPENADEWPLHGNGTLPIGHPYPGTSAVLIDERGLVAEEGEILLRGDQLFDGYLDQSDNEGRFVTVTDGVATPLQGPLTREHWYRSGDRARWSDAGLVHLGRVDRQVKRNGYRVELGEVEAVLRDCPGVAEVALVLAGTRLIAVYTGTARPAAELEASILATLPRYMVPDQFQHREQLPLNSNGKVDYPRLTRELTEAVDAA